MEKLTPIEKSKSQNGAIRLAGHIRVNRSAGTCYRYWRDLKNLPQFLKHITYIAELDPRRSHWVVTGPADTTVEWDAELTADIPGQKISWRSLPGAQVSNSGTVEFKSGRGKNAAEVQVAMTYDPPLGAFGEWLTGLIGGKPDVMLAQNLTRFKEAVEKGQTGPAHLTTPQE